MFSYTNTSAQYDCLYGQIPPGAQCGNPTQSSMTIPAPNVPGFTFDCDITVNYTTIECTLFSPGCNPPTRTILSLWINTIDWDYESCSNLTQYLMPGYPDNFSFSNANFRKFFGVLIPALSDAYFVDYYNSLTALEQEDFQCSGTYPNCSMPNENCAPFTLSATTPTCQDVCVIDDGNGNLEYRFSSCNTATTGCCVWKNLYCACVDGNGDIKETNVTRVGDIFQGYCGTPGPPTPGNCSEGTTGTLVHYEQCVNFCEPEE